MMVQRPEPRWLSRTRSLALVVWATAFVLTGILGWSAWQGYRLASDVADYQAWRQEAGMAARLPFLKKSGR